MSLANLPPDVVVRIARLLLPSRLSVDAMRATCTAWRAAIPRTRGIWLAIFPRSAEANGRAGLLEVKTRPVLSPVELLPPLPPDASCWGCDECTVALSRHDGDAIFKMCVVCGSRWERYVPLPEDRSPCALYNLPHRCISTVLTQPDYELFWWDDRDPRGWNLMPQDIDQARSLVDRRRTIYLATYPNNLFVDQEGIKRLHEQVAPPGYISSDESDFDPLVHMRLPLGENEGMHPWMERGHHLFIVDQEVFLCVLVRSPEVLIQTKLFAVLKNDEGDYHTVPRTSIGDHSLYLGANRPVVVESMDGDDGARANTAYVVDHDGQNPSPRILMINMESQVCEVITFPVKYGDTTK